MGTRRLLVKIVTEYSGQGADKAKKDVKGLGDSIANNLGKIALGAVVAAGAAMTAAVSQFVKDSLREFQQFDNGMREVFTLLPGISEDAMGKMQDDILAFSKATGQDATSSVKALYDALSAGQSADTVFDFLETASAAALAGVTDIGTATDGLTSVVNAYGKEVIDAATASDVMFTAVRLGKTNFEQLSNSLFNVVPTAASLGIQFTDLAANLSALTSQGVPTSVATTQLRQAFVEASKSGSELDKALQDLTGKTFAQLIADGKTSAQIFTELRDSMPEQDFRNLFGSVEAANAVLGITNDTAADVIENFGTLEDTLGATAEAAEVMADSVQHLDDVNQATWAAAKVAIGETLEPLRRAYLETSTAVANDIVVQKRLTDAYKDGTLVYSEWLRLSRLSRSGAEGQAEAMAVLERATGEVGKAVKVTGDHISNYETQNRLAAQAARDAADAAAEEAEAVRELAEAQAEIQEQYEFNTAVVNDYREASLDYEVTADQVAQAERDREAAALAVEEATLAAAEAQRELNGRMGAYFDQALRAGDATETVEEMLYREAQAANAPAETLALLATLTGNFTDEQIEAALKTAAMSEKARELGQAIAEGNISIQEARAQLVGFQADLENPIEPTIDTTSIDRSIERTAALISEMKDIPIEVATSVAIAGLDDAKRGIGDLLGLLDDLDGRHASASASVNTSAPSLPPSPSPGSGDDPDKKAVGGPVNQGRPYIVGERGPELFVPSTGGSVVPNGEFGAVYDQRQTIIYANSREAAALALATVQQERRKQLDSYMGV